MDAVSCEYILQRKKMEVCFIAHRGYSGKYLENTEEAFVEAIRHGSGGIETDVRVTADGVLVVSHNNNVIFADGTELPVSTSTYEELTAKPLANRFTNTKLYLCTFRRYLEICRDGNMICFIEFKGEFSDEWIHKAFHMAADVYDLKRCQLQSFHINNLIRAHKAFPELKIMLTCDEHDEDVDRCLEYGFDIDMDYRAIKKETVEIFHQKGLKVGVWTVNSKSAILYCMEMNVDFIESDLYSKVG